MRETKKPRNPQPESGGQAATRRVGLRHSSNIRRVTGLLASCALTLTTLTVASGGAMADTSPINPANPATPVTVSSDPLPTAQLDGVAWQQVVVGDVVYVAGKFSKARPSGASPGSQTVTRNNVLAYRLSTGVLIDSFAPTLNGQALSIAASPDGSRIYVGGEFTSVNGVSRSRIVALNASNGSVVSSFNPRIGGTVRALAVSADTVYAGGIFTSVGSASRSRLAAFRPSDGALLLWNPKTDNRVNALVVSPDSREIIVGGAFTTLNGSSRPGYGLGRVDAVTGESLSLGVNSTVRNAGKDSAILSLSSDGANFYGTGYIFGGGGNLEGSFAGAWSNGSLKWVEDCHGDSYGVWASPTAVYLAGHPHYCGNIGGFPETQPRSWHRAVAFSKAPTGVMTKDIHGYPSFTGVASPSLLNWFPDMDTGTASGQSQGPWAVTGNVDYVAMAGEFRNVNGRPQQGLTRFAVRALAPNADGPRVTGANTNPTLSYQSPGTVRVSWRANWDRDNEVLTYQLIRDGASAPAYTVTRASRFYERPTVEYTDTGLTAGQHTYRLLISDPLGNVVRSDIVRVDVPIGATAPHPDPPLPQPFAAADAFQRSASGNWGAADIGGNWTHSGSTALWSVDGVGKMNLNRGGLGLTANLGAVAQQDTSLRIDVALDKVANGSGIYLTSSARKTAQGEYQGVVKVSAAGNVTVDLVRVVAGASTKLVTRNVTGPAYRAGSQLAVRFQATGNGTTELGIRVWPVGSPEPTSWNASVTDTAPELQRSGSIALTGYISGSTTNTPVQVSFDNLNVGAG